MWHSRSFRHTLYPCPCFLQEVSIVTIPLFQGSCPHESNQDLQFSYHVCSYYLFARAYDYLIPVVDGYKIRFMWWTSLIHGYLIPVSCCISIPFFVHKCLCYFILKFWILFSPRFERLIMWWWSKYPGLRWGFYKFHVFGEIVDFVRYKACRRRCCCWWDFIWSD